MSATLKPTTTVSTKGQVILPKAIRDSRRWKPGTKLIIEETKDGVLLRAAPIFAPTRPEDVAGSVKWDGPPVSIEDMNAAIDAELLARYARGRY